VPQPEEAMHVLEDKASKLNVPSFMMIFTTFEINLID
jgi:hypothetical protein